MRLGSFVGVMPGVKRVSPCGVSMMGRFFVLSGLMMLSCFAVVTRGMSMMLRRLLMVLGCFLGHSGCFLCTPTGNNGTPASEKSFLYDKHFFPLKRSTLVTFAVEEVRLVSHLCRGRGHTLAGHEMATMMLSVAAHIRHA
jgi:hypothetical protein